MSGNRFKKSVDAATSNTLESIQDNTLDNILTNINPNILDNVVSKEKKNKGSNYTFYLSQEVADALAKLSKKTKQSKSAIINDILKAVLADKQN